MDLITQLFNQENLSPFSWCEANTTTQPVKWAKQTETTAPTLKQRYFSFQSVKITRQVIWQKRYTMWKTRLVTYSVVKKMKPCYKKTTERNGQLKQGRISLSRSNSQDWPRQNFSFQVSFPFSETNLKNFFRTQIIFPRLQISPQTLSFPRFQNQ